MMRNMPARETGGRRKRIVIQVLLGLMGILLIYTIYVGNMIWNYAQRTVNIPADAAIVLGAAVWEGEPSPVFRGRIDHALWLYDRQYIDKLIFTGGRSSEDELAESEVARQYAIKHGVSESDILIETASTITEQNLHYANEIGDTAGLSSYLIVSDQLHMKRAMMMAEDMGLKANPSPASRSAYQSLRSKVPFLIREVFYYIGYQLVAPFR
ncbi:multidrug MFS transporter [Paenibacillus lautus]|uniref:YdcF family protein n=1 Tax=Paenibacillus TaxID=44249 RepID=UPI000BF6D57B|nr:MULTISPECIES: YdcF family protein [Paenibacillus]GIO96802.1 multidrug MFS transporter [Paenibacillus lautus]